MVNVVAGMPCRLRPRPVDGADAFLTPDYFGEDRQYTVMRSYGEHDWENVWLVQDNEISNQIVWVYESMIMPMEGPW